MTNVQKVGSQSLASREQFGPLTGAGSTGYATMTQKNSGSMPGKRMPIIRQAEALDENRIVLYKKGK